MVDLFTRFRNSKIIFTGLFLFVFFDNLQPAAAVRVNFLAIYESTEGLSVKNGYIEIKPKTKAQLILIGSGIDNTSLVISFSKTSKQYGKSCEDDREPPLFYVKEGGLLSLQFEESWGGSQLYLCVREINNTSKWLHQGQNVRLKVLSKSFSLPLWLQYVLIGILMMLSGMFSGLNLGLMALDPNELRIVSRCGTKRQKKFAKKIMPVRQHGNFLLCTLLLGNTLVNSSFTILLDNLTSGIVAIVGSTLAIVIFGEIVPQSICSRYGLAVGAYTIYLTKLFMVLTFPLSFPVSKLLDFVLGKELGTIYNKQQLLEMLKLQSEYNDLEQDEVGIISGALKYKSKTVQEVMTAIDDCFLLDEEAVLDFKTMSAIVRTGYSRIPVYSGDRYNIVALLFVKDLAFVDPDDCIPLLSVIKFYNHPVHKVFFDTTLDKALEEFKQGTTHLSIVLKINDGGGDMDPFYECIGIVTLEDIIEEIIQAEIVDETDVYISNSSGQKVLRKHGNQDFSLFMPSATESQPKISPQLAFAIFQYLSTTISVFHNDLISKNVLKKLIDFPGVTEERDVDPEDKTKDIFLYKKGFHCDHFILIIEGRVKITVGSENILFEDGPFSSFGIGALTCESGQQFTPDYTVKLLSRVQYLKVSRNMYRSAVRATQMERQNKTPENYQEYDEVFWKDTKTKPVSSSPAPDTVSCKSYDSERGTPVKQERKMKNNLLRRLTPKYDRKKDKENGGKDREDTSAKSNSLNDTFGSSLENPLMSTEEEMAQENVVDRTNNTIHLTSV